MKGAQTILGDPQGRHQSSYTLSGHCLRTKVVTYEVYRKRTQQEDTAPVGGRPTSSSKSLHGFEPISTAKSGAPTVSDVFSKSNLSGKEIWHIMIPSSVPVKDFSQIALDDIKSGKAVTTHNGVDYGFVNEENSFSNTKLLVPSQRESEYRAGNCLLVPTNLYSSRLMLYAQCTWTLQKLSTCN